MDFFEELIYEDIIAGIPYSLEYVAQMLEAPIEDLRTICENRHLGKRSSEHPSNIIFFKGQKYSDYSIEALQFYYEHPDIEEKVIREIERTQPTTLYKLSEKLGIKRERLTKIVDELTFIDRNLFESKVGAKWYLFYGENGERLANWYARERKESEE